MGRVRCIRPKRAADPAHGFAGQQISRIGVDPGRADLGVPEDALDHVQVYVPFPLAHLAFCRIIVHLFGYFLREIRALSDHLKNASRNG